MNEALRLGLDALERASEEAKPYRTEPAPLGLRSGLSYDNIGELLAQTEREDFK